MVLCHREGLQLQMLSVPAPEEMEAMFVRLLLADSTFVLLCALYRPRWQGSAPFTFLTDHLDTIMTTHGCQNILIVGDIKKEPGG